MLQTSQTPAARDAPLSEPMREAVLAIWLGGELRWTRSGWAERDGTKFFGRDTVAALHARGLVWAPTAGRRRAVLELTAKGKRLAVALFAEQREARHGGRR